MTITGLYIIHLLITIDERFVKMILPDNVEHISASDAMMIIENNNLGKINKHSIYLIFLGMGVKTIDGRHICPSIFEEDCFNFIEENSILYEDCDICVDILKNVSKMNVIQSHHKRDIDTVIKALEKLLNDGSPITLSPL